MKTLCILANEFPYGTWEPYLETELVYLSDIPSIKICSLQLRDADAISIRTVPINSSVIPVRYINRFRYFLGSFVVIFDSEFYRELIYLIKSRRLNPKTVLNLFVFLSRAHHEASTIFSRAKKEQWTDILFYSYRFEYQPYVAILLKKKLQSKGKIVCRAHRYDLYEDQHRGNYIPLRHAILDNVDRVFPCSENGAIYLRNLFPDRRDKIQVRFLGTEDYGPGPDPERKGRYHIVTCSNAVKVKRLDKIVDALSMITKLEIIWTHYGDGPLLKEIQIYAKKKLPKNIIAEFKGSVPNNMLMQEYQNTAVDVFVNVSESEGIPVSIMEAMSFGIPCIATDVGGTGELLNLNNGILLPPDFKKETLSDAIFHMCIINPDDYKAYRNAARNSWIGKFNAENNYKRFAEEINSLMANPTND